MKITEFQTRDWKYSKDIGILAIRVIFGFVLLYGHGFAKISTIFSGQPIHFGNPIGIGTNLSFYLAAFAEGICSILLIFGLFTRFAAIILTINFTVIVYLHAFVFGDGYSILQLRFLYYIGFISLIFSGPGKISLDNLIFNNRGNRLPER